jgi:hypothetical protein
LINKLNIPVVRVMKIRSKIRHPIEPNNNIDFGVKAEIMVSNRMKELNIRHELMPHSHSFDILVNNKIKIDVKSSWKSNIPPSQIGRCVNDRYHFQLRGHDKHPADYYILVIPKCDAMFIVPGDIIPKNKTDIFMVYPSARPEIGKYQKYLNRWDLLRE